jgi:hypothetical protein
MKRRPPVIHILHPLWLLSRPHLACKVRARADSHGPAHPLQALETLPAFPRSPPNSLCHQPARPRCPKFCIHPVCLRHHGLPHGRFHTTSVAGRIGGIMGRALLPIAALCWSLWSHAGPHPSLPSALLSGWAVSLPCPTSSSIPDGFGRHLSLLCLGGTGARPNFASQGERCN